MVSLDEFGVNIGREMINGKNVFRHWSELVERLL